MITRQKAGERFTFISKFLNKTHSVILPERYGITNDEVYWYNDSKSTNGGRWVSRKFKDAYTRLAFQGKGTQGLLGRFKVLRRANSFRAKKLGYKPILTSAEEMVIQWRTQKRICAACKSGKKLSLLGNTTAYDHDHETGQGRGFTHSSCNWVEPIFRAMSPVARRNYLKYVENT